MSLLEDGYTVSAGGAQPAVRADPSPPGIAFPGQGVGADAVASTLSKNQDHWLVGALLAHLGSPSIEALDLADIRVSQAATYVAALVAAHGRVGPIADVPVVVGHSLGELAALAYARAIRPEDGLRLALARGQICHAAQRRRPGAMIAVIGLDHGAVEKLRRQVSAEGHGVLEIAGINGRRQTVLSGDRSAVASAAARIEGSAARAVLLPIDGAFHSSLMADALSQWRRVLRSVRLVRSEITVVSCIDALPHREPEMFRELLAAALVLPVRWVDTMDTVRRLGVQRLWEAGPGQVLRSLARRGGVVQFVDVPAQPVG